MSARSIQILEFELKGALMGVRNLNSSRGIQTYQLFLRSGQWPREDELQEFFNEFRPNSKFDAAVEVCFLDREAIINVVQ